MIVTVVSVTGMLSRCIGIATHTIFPTSDLCFLRERLRGCRRSCFGLRVNFRSQELISTGFIRLRIASLDEVTTHSSSDDLYSFLMPGFLSFRFFRSSSL